MEADEPIGHASPTCLMSEQRGRLPDNPSPVEVAAWRQTERVRLRAERTALNVEIRQVKAEALSRHLDAAVGDLFGPLAGRVVSGYWPIKGELDLRPWLARLHEAGAVIALPVVEVPQAPLVFRRWSPGQRMERGHWGIPVPPVDAERLSPEICLAPLVGWDEKGYRLGYGGGYFDRTLAALQPQPRAVGVGLQSARLDTIYPQSHDIHLSAIVTEAGLQVSYLG